MDKLHIFCKSLQTLEKSERYNLLSEINASDKVIQSVDEVVESFAKNNIKLIIEPKISTLSVGTKNDSNNSITVYTGDYTYLFEKNGKFYDDVSASGEPVEKTYINIGENIKFFVDKNNNQLVSVYESIAGNTFGEKIKKGSSFSTFLILTILIIVGGAILSKIV